MTARTAEQPCSPHKKPLRGGLTFWLINAEARKTQRTRQVFSHQLRLLDWATPVRYFAEESLQGSSCDLCAFRASALHIQNIRIRTKLDCYRTRHDRNPVEASSVDGSFASQVIDKLHTCLTEEGEPYSRS